MKHALSLGFWVAAVGLFLWPVRCQAQQEQWLEYHTLTEPRGYQWIELSTNAPAGVALPSDLNPGAMFGRWKNGLEKSDGRLICVARTVKGGSVNRLYVDSNGNGNLDDEKAITTENRPPLSSGFPPVKFTFKGEDGPISYHLILRYYQFDKNRSQLLAASGCCYEGNVDFGGKKHKITLQDSTLNGLFNDRNLNEDRSDSVMIGVGDKSQTRFLGDMIEVDGQLFNMEVARDGAFVKVKKAEGVQMGTVRVPEGVTSFSAIGKTGHFTRKPEKGELKLPLGKYRVQEYELKRKDDKNTEWELSGRGFGKAAEFVVRSNTTARADVGEPVRVVVEASEEKGRIQFGLKLRGNLGETVDIQKGTQRPRAPQLFVADKGSYRSTNTFEYG
jgi:hypothetical protein